MKLLERQTCRISGEPLIEVLNFGNIPISAFPMPSDPNPTLHPLVLSLCKKSGLVQLKHTVDPDEMYSQYWYMSGVNLSMKKALESIVQQAMARNRMPLAPNDIVVDIASNDGTLLSFYPNNLF